MAKRVYRRCFECRYIDGALNAGIGCFECRYIDGALNVGIGCFECTDGEFKGFLEKKRGDKEENEGEGG